jgi:hypothetical protein
MAPRAASARPFGRPLSSRHDWTAVRPRAPILTLRVALGRHADPKCSHFQAKTAPTGSGRMVRKRDGSSLAGLTNVRSRWSRLGSCRAASMSWPRREGRSAGAGGAIFMRLLTAKPATRIGVITPCWGYNIKIGRASLMRAKACAAASAAVLLSLIALDSASAEGGCGPGFHRNPYGRCRPNEGPVVVAPAAPVVVAPGAPVVVAPAPVVCRGGLRWHPRLRRCVVL